jgi:hypothetical protein
MDSDWFVNFQTNELVFFSKGKEIEEIIKCYMNVYCRSDRWRSSRWKCHHIDRTSDEKKKEIKAINQQFDGYHKICVNFETEVFYSFQIEIL